MPKLQGKQAKEADTNAENWGSFQPLDPGVYLARLDKVTVSENKGKSGYHYWKWEFVTVGAGDEPADRRIFNNTSLSPQAIGGLGATFAAFGVDSNTDTDTLIGELVAVQVSVALMTDGSNRMGQKVEAVLPADSHPDYEGYAETAGVGGTSASDLD